MYAAVKTVNCGIKLRQCTLHLGECTVDMVSGQWTVINGQCTVVIYHLYNEKDNKNIQCLFYIRVHGSVDAGQPFIDSVLTPKKLTFLYPA